MAAATVHDFFNLLSVIILFPLELIFHPIERTARFFTGVLGNIGGFRLLSPVKVIVKLAVHEIIHLLHKNPVMVEIDEIVLLFVSLKFLTDIIKKVALKRIEAYIDEFLFKTPGRAFPLGLILTSLVQSSSVTISLDVPFATAGLLTLEEVFPYTHGANVGTTVTAIMAALITKDPHAITVSFSHLFFNLYGILIVYSLLKRIPLRLARGLSSLAVSKKPLVLLYIIVTFYLIPFIIFITGR